MVESNVLPFDYPDFFLVVSNEMFAEIAKKEAPLTYKVYEVENEVTAQATSKKVNKLVGNDFQVSSSFYTEYKQGKEGNAITLFIFGFLFEKPFLGTLSLIFRFQPLIGKMKDG